MRTFLLGAAGLLAGSAALADTAVVVCSMPPPIMVDEHSSDARVALREWQIEHNVLCLQAVNSSADLRRCELFIAEAGPNGPLAKGCASRRAADLAAVEAFKHERPKPGISP